MDSITLDFSDASFNVDEENTFIIEDDGMIYMSSGGAVLRRRCECFSIL